MIVIVLITITLMKKAIDTLKNIPLSLRVASAVGGILLLLVLVGEYPVLYPLVLALPAILVMVFTHHYTGVLSQKRWSKARKVLHNFALEHGGVTNISFEPEEFISTVNRIGNLKRIGNIVLVNIGDRQYRIFNTNLDIRKSNARNVIRTQFTVFELRLQSSMPHIYIDSQHNHLGRSHLIGGYFESAERVRLEGGFENDFIIYADKQNLLDVWDILSPDIMEFLQSQGKDFNVEIINDRLYILKPKLVLSSVELERYLQTIEVITDRLQPRLDSYKSSSLETSGMY